MRAPTWYNCVAGTGSKSDGSRLTSLAASACWMRRTSSSVGWKSVCVLRGLSESGVGGRAIVSPPPHVRTLGAEVLRSGALPHVPGLAVAVAAERPLRGGPAQVGVPDREDGALTAEHCGSSSPASCHFVVVYAFMVMDAHKKQTRSGVE